MASNRPLTEEEIKKLKHKLYQRIDEIFGRGVPPEDDPDFEIYEDMTNWLDGCTTLEDFVNCFKPGEWCSYVWDLDIDNAIPEYVKNRAEDCDEAAIEEYSEAFYENYGIDLLI
jgi:hypothetical protein